MRLILLCLLAVVSLNAFGQGDWIAQNGPYGGTVRDVEYDAGSGWTYAIFDSDLYYSTDDGDTWTQSVSGISGIDIEIGGGTVYFLQGFNVYTSPTGQDNFNDVTTGGSLNGYRLRLMPSGTLVSVGTSYLYVSTDGGDNWSIHNAGHGGGFVTSMLEVTSDNKAIVINATTGVLEIAATPTVPAGTIVPFTTAPGITGPVTSIATNNAKTTLYLANTTSIYETPATGGGVLTTIEGGTAVAVTLSSVTQPSLFELSADGLHMFFIDNFNHEIHEKTVLEAASAWNEVGFPGQGRIITTATGQDVNIITVGANTGLYRSIDAGSTFYDVQGDVLGVRALSMGSYQGTLYMNGYQSGVYYSYDDGYSWNGEPRVPGEVSGFAYSKDFATSSKAALFALVPSLLGGTDLYRTKTDGIFEQWKLLAAPTYTVPEFTWVDLMDDMRAIGMTNDTNYPLYYSLDQGTNWGLISISGLPTDYVIYNTSSKDIQMASSTEIFVKLFNTNTGFYEYYFITVSLDGATGTATNITSSLPYPAADIQKMIAEDGKLYAYYDNPSPDQFAVSFDGGATWQPHNAPASFFGEMFVTDNGYIFLLDYFGAKIYLSRDDGASFTMTPLASSNVSQSISDIFLDKDGFAYLARFNGVVYKSKYTVVIPNDPSNLVDVGITSSTIALKWNDNAVNEEVYLVERATDGINYTSITSLSGDENCATPSPKAYYVDRNLDPNTTYQYRITAVNDAGSSQPVMASFATLSACAVETIPDGRSWTGSNAGGNGYVAGTLNNIGIRYLGNGVYEVEDISMSLIDQFKGTFTLDCDQTVVIGGSSGSVAETVKPNGLGTWNPITEEITIQWTECGDQDKFETVTFTINTPGTDPLPSVPNVQVLVSGDSEVEISWSTGFNQKDFVVERSTTGPASGFSQIGGSSVVAFPSHSFVDPGPFSVGLPYYYRITARNHNTPTPLTSEGFAEVASFSKPNFIVSATEVTNLVGILVGSHWGDFDGDGLDDLLTISGDISGVDLIPEVFIFKNLGTGDFQKLTIDIEDNRMYTLASLVDFNSDGKLDMALSQTEDSYIDLYQGIGDFTFVKLSAGIVGQLATQIQGNIAGISWADPNRDGRLDVLVCASFDNNPNIIIPPQLFTRTLGGSYTKVAGGELQAYNQAAEFGAWADYDNDSNPDVLIVSGDGCILYKGNGNATFTKVLSGVSGITDGAATAAWGDYNSDGNMDLFLGNFGTNVLYENNGDGTFTRDVTTIISSTNVFSFSPQWADVNNDSFLDLVIPAYLFGSSQIFLNTVTAGVADFSATPKEKLSDFSSIITGAALADYNVDGFVDLSAAAIGFGGDFSSSSFFPTNFNLYKNNHTAASSRKWSEVRLRGNPSNAQAIGAQVFVQAGTKNIFREVQAPTSTRSQNSTNLHFGLGSASSITSITVYWPSGTVQVYNSPPINTALLIEEDSQAPAVSLLSPLSGTTGVSLNSTVAITFDEATVRDNSKNIYIKRVSDDALLFSQSVSTGVKAGNKYTFTFGGPMLQGTEYAVSFDDNAFADVYGNQLLSTGAWTFTTSPGPQVTLLSPLDGAGTVPSNTDISITFDIPATAVAAKNLKIYETSDLGTVKFTIAATAATTTVNTKVFNVPSNLLTETDYTAILDAGAFKDAGNAVSAVTQWSFTTMAGPVVNSISPGDGATGVNANTPLVIMFDQDVTAQSGKHITLFKAGDPTPVFDEDVTVGTMNPPNVFTIALFPALDPSTNYTVVLDAFAFADATGNLSSGLSGTAWNFSTDPGPSVTTFLPANAATGISTLAPIELTFNRSIASIVPGKKIEVFDGATSIFNTDVSVAGVVAGAKYTIDAPGTTGTLWPADKVLTVVLDAGAFRDVSNNQSQAVAPGAYTFTTMPGPQVVSLSPADGETGVDVNMSLVITFDQTVFAQGTKKIKLFKDGVATPVFQTDVANGGNPGSVFTFVVTPLLLANTNYTVTVEAGSVKDAIGNSFPGITATTEWNFTTSPGAAVTTFLPANGGNNISTAAAIELTFNRALASAVSGKTIEVFDGATSIFSADVSVDGTIAGSKYTISAPSSRWPVSKLLTVVLDAGAFLDVGDNASQGVSPGAYSFTTMAGPQVSSTIPADESAGIAANMSLAITFAQSVIPQATKKIHLFRDGDPTAAFETDVTNGGGTGTTFTFPVTPKLDRLTLYNVTIDAAAFKDAVGNPSPAVGATAWNFTTDPGASVTGFSPGNGAVGISAAAFIELTFNRSLTSAVAGKKIQVLDGVTSVLNLDVSTNGTISGTKYKINAPSTRWPAGKVLTVILDEGAFLDGASNDSQGLTSGTYSFTIDVGPVATSFLPADGALNISTQEPIEITFNRTLASAVAGKKIQVFNGATSILNLDVSTNGSLAGATYTLDAPLSRWPTNTTLTVVLDAGAFLDGLSNASQALTAGTYSFTTIAGASVTALLPLHNATTVPANTTLEITFDRPMTAVPGKKIKILTDPGLAVAFQADVSSVSASGNKFSYTVTPKLSTNAPYIVTVDPFSFTDTNGDPFGGIGNGSWLFRTRFGPTATSFSPSNGIGNVLDTAPIVITFDRNLVSAVAGKNIRVMDGATVVRDVDVSTNGSISNATYTLLAPTGKWPTGKQLTVDLDAGAFLDAGGNESTVIASGSYSFTIESGPAVTDLIPDDGATGVFLNASLTITFNRNVTAVAGKTIRVMDGATEVVNDDVAAVGSVSGASYVYPAPAGGWPFDTELTVLLDAGAFVDSGSKPSAAISGTEWTFTTVAVLDVTAPAFATFDDDAYATLEKGFAAFTVSVTVTDQSVVSDVIMFHRKVAEETFQELVLTPVSGKWEGQVTNSFADDMGFEYYFEATDAAGNTGREPASPLRYRSRISFSGANIPSVALPIAGSKQSWRVISIPFVELSTTQVQTLFQVLGGVDRKKWRLLTYDPDPAPTGSWSEFPDFSTIVRGTGYFVNTRNENPVSISLTGAKAPSESRDNLFQMQLTAGWNQIGNPYSVSINWNDARAYNAAANLSELKVYINGYTNGNELTPGQGGFVFVAEAATISVPFAGQTGPGRTHTFVKELDQPNWKLPLTLVQDGIENKLGAIGMYPGASTGYDELDDVTPPRFFDFLEINFGHKEFTMGSLSRDIVPTTDDHVWEFEVESNLEQDAVLSWDNSGFGDNDVELFLFDLTTNLAVNMREESRYNFDPQSSRKFKIYFGSDARSKIRPEQNLLGNPSPNPTSGISYIPFALPEGNSEYGVKIEVFDVMGRKTATLEDGTFAPGLYKTQWNGQETPHSNGLYSVRMTVVTGSDRAVYTGKILLTK